MRRWSPSLAIGKCKSEVHKDYIPPQSEWQLSRKQTTNAGDHAGERESLFTVGGNVN
jgi:hypothetical protein